MSIHRSLKERAAKPRSVLKRHERLAKALREQKWREGMSIFGLPKFNPPRFKPPKKEDEATKTTLDGTDILEQHRMAKEKAEKDKKTKKGKKETTGRK